MAMMQLANAPEDRKSSAMRLSSIFPLALLAILILVAPASAIVRGAPATDADGVRNFVLRIESELGELCSAVLVAPDIVLTAAHCVLVETRYAVHGLDRNFRDVRREVVSLVLHPSFQAGTPPRTQPGIDLALLRLESPMGPGFEPMPLRALSPPMEGEDVTIAGFGTTSFNNRASARTLRYTYLRLRGEIRIGNTMLMASDSERESRRLGAGACQGDSGGPILRGDPGTFALLGIVSWSSGASGERERSACGGLTAITPVTPHLDWINARIRQLRG
jgi:hypothetical protein